MPESPDDTLKQFYKVRSYGPNKFGEVTISINAISVVDGSEVRMITGEKFNLGWQDLLHVQSRLDKQ